MSNIEFGEGGELGRFAVDLQEVQAVHESGHAPDAYSALYGATLNTEVVQQRIEEIRSVWTYEKYVAAVRQVHGAYGSRYERPYILPQHEVTLPKYIPPQIGAYIPKDFYNSKGEARHAIVERYTARNFFQLFKTEVGASPDIATFAWRIKAAANTENIRRAERHVPTARTRTAYDSHLYTQLTQFMKEHPDSAEQALRLWEEAVDTLLTDDGFQRTIGLRRAIDATLVTANTIGVDNKTYQFTSPNLQKYLERITALPKDSKEIMNYVAMTKPDSSRRNLQVYEEFDELLSNPDTVPKGAGKLMQTGLDIMMRFLESASALEDDLPEENRLATKLDQLLKTARERSGALNFVLINKLANTGLIYGQLQQSKVGPRLQPLAETIDDLPQAIDRICLVVMASRQEDAMSDAMIAQFSAAVHCARRAVLEGIAQKKDQKILSEYDLILRYPDVTADQLDQLIAEMQRAKSENESDAQTAAHRLYRSIRAHSNTAWFKRNRTGYGWFR